MDLQDLRLKISATHLFSSVVVKRDFPLFSLVTGLESDPYDEITKKRDGVKCPEIQG